jgi:hypothetical protein
MKKGELVTAVLDEAGSICLERIAPVYTVPLDAE